MTYNSLMKLSGIYIRVRTRPGKLGKMTVYLENLEISVGVTRGYTDHHQGRGHSIRPTAALINIHEYLI